MVSCLVVELEVVHQKIIIKQVEGSDPDSDASLQLRVYKDDDRLSMVSCYS